MAFIIESDYNVQLRSEISNVIDPTQEKSKLKKAEDMAVAQMKNYLAGRYDIEQIFIDAPAEGDDDARDSFVVMCAIDMALYHLWSKEGGNRIPQTRSDRYADCLEWLRAVQKGAACNLPLLTNEDGTNAIDIRIWSKSTPESNRY
jgi:phage gp36-like protein